jgi:uncharacterized protein YwgA
MEIIELVIALLSAGPECIEGRTAVQKLGYFASVKLKKEAGYRADYYGPFSSQVAGGLQNLTELDFVVERGRQTARNRIMYSYSLTEDGRELARTIEKENSKEFAVVKDIVTKCSRIVHCNYLVLSWAAKVHYVLKRAGRPITYEQAIEASKSFGWKLEPEQVDTAVELLKALGLVKS